MVVQIFNTSFNIHKWCRVSYIRPQSTLALHYMFWLEIVNLRKGAYFSRLSRWHFVLLISYNFRNTVHCVRTNTSFIMWSPLSVQLPRGLVQLPRMCVNLNSADFQILAVFLAGYILHLFCFIFSWFVHFYYAFFFVCLYF